MAKVKAILRNGEIRLYDRKESAWEAGAIIIYKTDTSFPRTQFKPTKIGGFELVGSDHTLRGCVYGQFKDGTGEIRNISPENFPKLAIASNWLEYDNNKLKEKITDLKTQLVNKQDYITDLYKKIDDLDNAIFEMRKIMAKVYIINEKGGPGSRKKVRDLLTPELEICEVCNKPIIIGCNCENY